MTYTGSLVQAKPNHQVAFMQTGPNEQKVWFSIDVRLIFPSGTPGASLAYYNRRYRANSSSPWYWEYATSRKLYGVPGFVESVLYSAFPRYQDASGHAWNYIMYTVNQPPACGCAQAGIAMVQYSSDGVSWTSAAPLHHVGGPSAPCAPELGDNLVQVEALDAIDNGSGYIYLVGMEGDVGTLVDANNMNFTFASWGTSDYAHAGDVSLDLTYKDMSVSGVFNPVLPGALSSRYLPYSYFFNMALAWDAANGDLYWTRGYPYPYDRRPDLGQSIPSASQIQEIDLYNSYWGTNQGVQGCAPSPLELYPNRYQIYKMHLGSLLYFYLVHNGTWTLVADRGNYVGYEQTTVSPHGNAALIAGQTAGSRDAGAASFLRDSSGNLVRTSGIAYVFGGSTLHQTLSVGPCRTTGNESIVMEAIP